MHFSQKFAQRQRLQMLLSPSLQKSLAILEMPIDELYDFVQLEIEQNPLIENHTTSFTLKPPADYEIATAPTLRAELLEKVFAVFEGNDDKHMAELILGNLSTRGILENYDEIRSIDPQAFDTILLALRQWSPTGLGAKSLQDLLWAMLQEKPSYHPLAATMLRECFAHLVQQDFVSIGKKLHISTSSAIEIFQQNIATLTLFSLDEEKKSAASCLHADLSIEEQEGQLQIKTPDDNFFIIPKLYHDCLDEPDLTFQERTYVRRHLADALWLKRALERRGKSLVQLGEYLCKHQVAYLLGESLYPLPLDMKHAAAELEISLSTLSRTLSKKYLYCVHGMISLKQLFPKKVVSVEGQSISQGAVLDALRQLIEKESKKKPLTDQELSVGMRKVGFRLSRRTISKYRERLKIFSSHKRKN